jgi:nitrite reductase (NADH) small subunit
MPVVARLEEVPHLGKKQITLGDQQFLLVNSKGTIYAVEGECPHQGAPLAGAILKDNCLICPRHGYRFELKDGSCKEHPEFTLKIWPVRIVNNEIIVDLA